MSKPLIPAQRGDKFGVSGNSSNCPTVDLCDLWKPPKRQFAVTWNGWNKGILERNMGAILSQRMIFEQEYQQRAQHHPEEKKRIGELAAP